MPTNGFVVACLFCSIVFHPVFRIDYYYSFESSDYTYIYFYKSI